MAFSVTSFKTNLAKGGGGARPSLYKVDINAPSGVGSFSTNSNLLVKAAAIPASNIAPLTTNFMGRAYKLAGFRTFDNWSVTVINDENMEARQTIMEWMVRSAGMLKGNRSSIYGAFVDSGGNRRNESNAVVTQMGTDGSEVQKWNIFNMWPTELGEIALDWSSDALEEYTVSFCYDYWSHGTVSDSEYVPRNPHTG